MGGGSQEDEDERILAGAARPKRERSSVKSYKIDSDEDEDEDSCDQPLGKQVKLAQKGQRKAKSADDDDDDVTDLTESPKKIAKTPAKAKAEPKAVAKKEEEVVDLDDEEEALLLQIMSQHSTGTSPTKAAVKTTATAKVITSTPRKLEEKVKQTSTVDKPSSSTKGHEQTEKDATLGSARVESSKIKFSRSVPVMAPNAKKISRNTFLVQCEDPSLDFEGDSGVIGTLKSTSDSSLQLDIKGQLFEGSVLSSNTMMVVDVGASEVKIEAIMNNFVQLQKIQNPHDDNVDVELSDSGGEEDAADNDDDDGKGKGKGKGKEKKDKKTKVKSSKAKKKVNKAKKPISSSKKKK
jgi:hypothetical protein